MADIIRNEVIDAVLTRQTIREYKPVMLTPDQLETLTAAAMMAPSGRNRQPCHVRFVCNADMLKQMQTDFKNIVGWDTPVHTRSDKNPFYHNAPVFAAIFAQGNSQMDAGIMVENICIAAKGLGLGTCIVGSAGALFDDADVTNLLTQAELSVARDPSLRTAEFKAQLYRAQAEKLTKQG